MASGLNFISYPQCFEDQRKETRIEFIELEQDKNLKYFLILNSNFKNFQIVESSVNIVLEILAQIICSIIK